MKHTLEVRHEAELDVYAIADGIADLDLDGAIRCVEAVDRSFARLCEMPRLGRGCAFRDPLLAGFRRWPVEGFPEHLVFYRALDRRLAIIRVLHGARDLEAALLLDD